MKKESSSFDPKDYWESRLSKNYDLTGVGHFSLGTAYNTWLYRVRRRVFKRLLSRLHVEVGDSSVLDIGSGTGFYIEQWKRNGAQSVAGADLTTVAVERLRQNHPAEDFFQLDISSRALPNVGGPFDIISSFDVLFHIVDDRRYEQAIRNVHALLRPGGVFVFSDNFIHGDTIRWAHQVSRSLKDIEAILRQNGFAVVERVPMFVLMNSPIDSTWKGFLTLWNICARILSLSNAIGFTAGALLYPLELLLLRFVRESPSTEIMICRRVISASIPEHPKPQGERS